MKLITKMGLVSLIVTSFGMTACTNAISHHITNEGKIANASDVIFPKLDKAWQKNGIFPNSENLSKIRSGMSKDELYELIGRPQFSEAQHAHEWDYIMKFYQPDNSVKICQYKVIFDKNYKAQEFFWLPADCQNNNTPSLSSPAPAIAPVIEEKINLSADTLFKFDKFRQADILPRGQEELNALANRLVTYGKQGNMQVAVTGHTDRLGDAMYNNTLSLQRAQTVRDYLISHGVDASAITATGAGENYPVTQCDNNLPRNQVIACLQPNRRVEVAVNVYQAK